MDSRQENDKHNANISKTRQEGESVSSRPTSSVNEDSSSWPPHLDVASSSTINDSNEQFETYFDDERIFIPDSNVSIYMLYRNHRFSVARKNIFLVELMPVKYFARSRCWRNRSRFV